jgi:hypothetical protein
MALSNISKDHLNELIIIPNLQELEKDKIVKAIQRNSNNYSKLKILFKQMENIKKEINEVVKESLETEKLENIKCNFKKIPGKNYFLYRNQECELFFSILSPKEWKSKNIFINEYFYDYDHTLQKI